MSYTVLARRYRSTTFDEVVGQDHISRTLKKAIETGRIAHAYLFCGTRGVGKTSLARIMAKALNCEKFDKPTTTPCGKCNSCLGVARGDDIDVIEIDAASNTGVDNVRDLISNAQFRPARARFKVYIIDEVHMLSKAAFNALLKTMEEPPEHVKFILATTEVEKVLPTILSRCQRYDFRNIPTREIAEHLKQICKTEKIKADEDALLLVAKAGAGSMRDSLSMLDRLLSSGEKQINVELIEQTLGMPRTQSMFDLAEKIGSGDVKGVLEGADKLITAGLSADSLVAAFADHLRNLLILRACGPKSNLVEVPGLAIEDLNKQASQFEPAILTQDIAILEELRRSLRTSQMGRALLDATFVRLALAEQFTSVQELLERPGAARPSTAATASAPSFQKKKPELIDRPPIEAPEPVKAATAPQVVSDDEDDDLPRPGKVWESSGPSLKELLAQQAAATKAPPAARHEPAVEVNIHPVSLNDLGGVWSRVMGSIRENSPSLSSLLEEARLVAVEDGQAILRYPHDHESVVRILERNGKKESVSNVLSGLLNQPLGLKFEFDAPAAPSTSPPPARPMPNRPAAAAPASAPQAMPAPEPVLRVTDEMKQELAKDKLIKGVMDLLGGEIVRVE